MERPCEDRTMISKLFMFFTIAVAGAALSACERQVSYSADVKPILDNYCIQCHSGAGEGEAASGLALDEYDALMQGTKFGQIVVPGSSMSSSLYLVVTEKTDPKIHMPPHHDESLAEGRGFRLSRENIETIGTWIDQGAKNN
jgi:hypothetical protein